MSKIILKAHNISKQYRIGTIGTGSLSHDVNRWWHKIRGKEDPYLEVGAENDRSSKVDTDYVWALKDVSFEVNEGDVLGIIGKNGAGKSTLLKILSRITSPTTGYIKSYGRIASLLEVGTGFHPELTGRENIYLNGTILGMRKAEIKAKEDEIIDFSGCALYIDTPVKRYSSGMRVRLAFAVAAHLDPDILIVDEVLAVGDAEFQKKAIGKMKDISGKQGRTVLFVSHNMTSIKNLCQKCILLENGKTIFTGNAKDAVDMYLSSNSTKELKFNNKQIVGKNVEFISSEVYSNTKELTNGKKLEIKISYKVKIDSDFSLILNVFRGEDLAFAATSFHKEPYKGSNNYLAKFVIPPFLLNPGFHKFDFSVVDGTGNMTEFAYFNSILYFEVLDDGFRRGFRYNKGWGGLVSPILQLENLENLKYD